MNTQTEIYTKEHKENIHLATEVKVNNTQSKPSIFTEIKRQVEIFE